MPTSQNGWPVVDQSAVVERVIGGARIVNGWLKGDVDVIFTDLAVWLDRDIEASITPGCWGHHVKKIEGSSSYSNHSSGTAFDYNAPNHPMGSRNTYPAAKRDKIRARLKGRYAGVIRWGGDYTNRPDDMHFEIDDDRAAVKMVADKIRAEQKGSDTVPNLTNEDADVIIRRMRNTREVLSDTNVGIIATETANRILPVLGRIEDALERIEAKLNEQPPTDPDAPPA